MQVTLGLQLDSGLLVLPAGLPGYEKYRAEQNDDVQQDLGPCLKLGLPSLQLFLRSNEYYMGQWGATMVTSLLTASQRCPRMWRQSLVALANIAFRTSYSYRKDTFLLESALSLMVSGLLLDGKSH